MKKKTGFIMTGSLKLVVPLSFKKYGYILEFSIKLK